ncbi:class I adenylate-forming enzyme family protein [Massilia niabensis]|uniref:Class I adenylate-forming enzyme family protein n=1 Tax=Massilia niabensis TaxID=544910 RepID=A0ABW0KZR4_9BURK
MTDLDYYNEVSTIGDLLVRATRLHPQRDAIIFPDSRKSYEQLLKDAVEVGRGLLALGVRPGENIGVLAANCPEFAAALFGISLLGCVAVPLNARHKNSELAFIIENAQLTTLLTTADEGQYVDFCAVLRSALPSLADAADATCLALPEAPLLRRVVLLRGAGGTSGAGCVGMARFADLAAQVDASLVEQARQAVRLRDPALIIYTSGTTANPKGCVLSHEAVTRGPAERSRKRLCADGHPVTWGAGPLFHIGSMAPFIGTIAAAGSYLTDTYFDPGRALALMAREGVTNAWPWFPAVVQGLLDHPSFDAAALPALRHLIVIGPPALIERIFRQLPGVEVVQGCGMTETAGIFALSAPDTPDALRVTSQGKVVPGMQIRIIDPDSGAPVAPGQVGEIQVRGYCVMEGYYRDPAKTAATLDADGWLHTGDLYRQAADGNLMFQGRLKDMLKVGGENVAAVEVEAFLCEHPAVRLAEVVGKPDARLDEVPVAFVELRPGHSVDAAALIDFCKGRIASYKVPREIHFMQQQEWPMSATKVDKRALRARLAPA